MTAHDEYPGSSFGLRPDSTYQRVLEVIGEGLRQEGWAQFVTADHLLSSWRRLAGEVATYEGTIDDYTNDLCSRDGLALVLDRSPARLKVQLASSVSYWDDQFKAATDPDVQSLVGKFFRLDNHSGWWWRRIPPTGPLADYLAGLDGRT